MEERSSDKGEVDRVERVTVVHESLVSQRWHGQALLHITWHDPREEELVEDETGIHFPRVEVRAGILHEHEWVRQSFFFFFSKPEGAAKRGRTDVADVGPHVVNERFNSVDGSRDDKPAVVEPETYPQIVHEHRKSEHHGSDAPWSAKLPPGLKSQCELWR